MGEYSKTRTIVLISIFVASIIFEIIMVPYMNSYFDSSYKVIIAAVITYILFLYIVVFGGIGIYCLVLCIITKEKNLAFSLWLILISVIIGLGMYCFFSRDITSIIAECVGILMSSICLLISIKSMKK